MEKHFFNSKTAAKYLGVSDQTLRHSRMTKKLWGVKSPRYYKVGVWVRYAKEDLDKWLNDVVVVND